MRKLLTGLVSGIALLGLAACGDTDDTTTQSVEPGGTTEQAPAGDTGAGGTATPMPDTGGTGTGGTTGTGGQ